MDHLCQKNIGKDPFQWNEKGPDKDMFTLLDHFFSRVITGIPDAGIQISTFHGFIHS